MSRRERLELLVRLVAERQADETDQAVRDARDDDRDIPLPTHGADPCTRH